jgi:hypothetical protein
MVRPQPASEAEVVAPSRQLSLRPLGDDHVIEVWMMRHDRQGSWFDQVREVRVWEAAPKRADGRRGEHHIANQAQAKQQNLQGSTVASSISITGMSSLIGYTR